MTVEPVLFSVDAAVLEALASTIDPQQLPAALVVDWEHPRSKSARQAGSSASLGFTTELRVDSADDLARARKQVELPIICRIDAVGPTTEADVDRAIAFGADEILIAMVRRVTDVERVLELAAGRAAVGVMLETQAAVDAAKDLASLPIARAYVGLVDLALDRGAPSIFDALTDGTVDEVVGNLGAIPYGVAGMTLPEKGAPISAHLLLGEIARLGCSFSFLRRSFLRDLEGGPPGPAIARIRDTLSALERRSSHDVARDRRDFTSQAGRITSAP